jgi:tetratricopeptide (TPR) repeat protein
VCPRLVLLISLGVAGTAVELPSRIARGEPAEARSTADAKAQYDEGTRAYNLGQFDRAIAAFTRAYESDPAPILLFNIAQSHWKKGENERAVFFYRRYLDADPRTEQRGRVETRIRELEAALRAGGRQIALAPAPLMPAAGASAAAVAPASGTSPSRDSVLGGPKSPPGRADEPRAGLPGVVDTSATRTSGAAPPFYRRPWFWVAVGAVVVGTAAVALAARPGSAQRFDCGAICGLGTEIVRDSP